jgi:hypothetical protein
MTNEEQMLIRARMMQEFIEGKAHLATLEYQLERMGAKLMEIGKALCSSDPQINDEACLNAPEIQQLLTDYNATREKLARLKTHLVGIGWITEEPKP